jgi:H+/Cl- antiporter ClcA
MRAGALLTILVCELLVLMMMSLDIDSNSLSFVSTLVVVVIVAFTFSAVLSNIKSLTLTKNYGVSGIFGIVAGILYYWWAGDHLDAMVHWLQNYGVYFLMLIIFLCALILFFYKGVQNKVEKQVKENSNTNAANAEGNISHTA